VSYKLSPQQAVHKLCAGNIGDEASDAIFRLVDGSGDGLIEFEELLHFLESGQPKAEWALRKLIRSSIPTPIEYLTAFEGLPAHFRKSQLAELSKQRWSPLSDGLRARIADSDGLSLCRIAMDPASLEIECSDSSERRQLRVFRLSECSGVPLPAASIASRIAERRVRVCLLADNKPISNVLTVPAAWKPTEEDQWKFGESVWRESASNAVAQCNSFCVAIEESAAKKIELLLELCVTVKAPPQPLPPPMSPQSARSPMAATNTVPPPESARCSEMSCGWTKLEIHAANSNAADAIHRRHRLKISGGTFRCESDIKESDIRNDRRTSISLRKLKQALSGLESTVRISEQSQPQQPEMRWLPPHAICPVASCQIIAMHFELMADRWLRNNPLILERRRHRQDLHQSLVLFIADRPNLLAVLSDEWKAKLDALWRSQKKDRRFLTLQFRALLEQFVALRFHHKAAAATHRQRRHHIDRDTLHPETLAFVRRVVRANALHILCGNKPAAPPSTPLAFAPFDTEHVATA